MIVPSFPAAVWDGTTPTRLSPLIDAPPSSADWSRLVSELQAVQRQLLNRQDFSFLAVAIPPNNYTDNLASDPIDVGVPDGQSFQLITGTGTLSGDSLFTFRVSQSDKSGGTYDMLVETPINGVAMTTKVVSFTPTKRFIKVESFVSGDDMEGNAAAIVAKGIAPGNHIVNLGPNNYTGASTFFDTNSANTSLVSAETKDVIAYAITGPITGDTNYTMSFQESDANTAPWYDIPDSTLQVMADANKVFTKRFARTRKYVRVKVVEAGEDADGYLAVLVGRL